MKPRLGKQQMGKNYRAKPGNWIGASAHAGLNSNKYLVGLGYRPGPQLTLPGRIGSLTRAYTHSASSDWDIDTRREPRSVRLDHQYEPPQPNIPCTLATLSYSSYFGPVPCAASN